MKLLHSLALLGSLIITAGPICPLAHAEEVPEPRNKIAILVDSSGSFKDRQTDAINRIVALLDTMAQAKLHRWDDVTDEISVIALDAMPDVIWKGSLRDLKALPRDCWVARFKARGDYAKCTDIAGGFNMALDQVAGNPLFVKKYIIAFTDLVSEPPKTSACNCSAAVYGPPRKFPWERLQDVSIAVLWLPVDQRWEWQQVVARKGLAANFRFYTTSETKTITLSPPPKAEEDPAVAAANAAQVRTAATGWIKGFIRIVASIIALVVLAPLAFLFLRWFVQTLLPALLAGIRSIGAWLGALLAARSVAHNSAVIGQPVAAVAAVPQPAPSAPGRNRGFPGGSTNA